MTAPTPRCSAWQILLILLGGSLLIAVGMRWVDAIAVSPLTYHHMTLTINGHTVRADIADTPAKQQQGLMHRRHLAANQGMLFLFNARRARCFWMKDTLIPLTVAFFDEDHRILSLHRMTPRSREPHCSDKPVAGALEMRQDWFSDRDITPGDRLILSSPAF